MSASLDDDGDAGLGRPAVVDVAERPAAVIRILVPRADLPKAMRPAIAELEAALRDQGAAPAGPLFAHHFRLGDGTFDVEVGFPVQAPVAATGRVLPGCLPAARAVRATYRGGYEGLPGAWGGLRRWMERNGHAAAPHVWEVYEVGPATRPDPADWRTDLVQPLAP